PHLRAAATYLTNPAHDGDAPALPGVVLNAEQFARLQLARHLARPGQAVAPRAVVDYRQQVGGIDFAAATVRCLRFTRGVGFGVLNLLEMQFLASALGVEGIGPDVGRAIVGFEY